MCPQCRSIGTKAGKDGPVCAGCGAPVDAAEWKKASEVYRAVREQRRAEAQTPGPVVRGLPVKAAKRKAKAKKR